VTALGRQLEQRVSSRGCSVGVQIHPSSPRRALELKWMKEGVGRVEEAARPADLDRGQRRRVSGRGYEANIGSDLVLAAESL
jgi:hypothetical protein